jgi:ABC-type lipoprotein release transport system permease subunit
LQTLRIAWRNLWRNKTRSGIAISTVGLSFWLMLFAFGTNDYGYQELLKSAGKAVGGGVLVHGEGWWEDPQTQRVVRDPASIVGAAQNVNGVQGVGVRVVVSGLLTSSRAAMGVELRGIRWQDEEQFTELKKHVQEGAFLDVPHKRPLVLGAGVVSKLGAKLGDRLVLTANGMDGEMTRALFRLTGIVKSGSRQLDDAVAVTTLEAAQKAVGYQHEVSQVGLLLDTEVDPSQVKAELNAALHGEAGLEMLTWREAVPELIKLIEMDKQQGWIILILIMLVVAFGVANTMLMSVLERVRELGLQAALGMTPLGVGKLILAETLVLSAVSMTVGLVLGLLTHAALVIWGIPLGSLGENLEMGGVAVEDYVLSSYIDVARWVGGSVVVFLIMVLSALYPARRAARLDPAQAMRTYE